VSEIMLRYMGEHYGNPLITCAYEPPMKELLEHARQQVAIMGLSSDVILTNYGP